MNLRVYSSFPSTYTNNETYSRTFNDIPVKRNALTTLKGNFFTAGAQITVNVEDAFDNNSKEYDLKFTAKEVQAALDAAREGETTTIYLGATIEGDVIEFGRGECFSFRESSRANVRGLFMWMEKKFRKWKISIYNLLNA